MEEEKSDYSIKQITLGATLATATFASYKLITSYFNRNKGNRGTTVIKREKNSNEGTENQEESKATLYFNSLDEQSRAIWHYCLLNDVGVAVDLLELHSEKLATVNPFKNGIILKDQDFFLTEG